MSSNSSINTLDIQHKLRQLKKLMKKTNSYKSSNSKRNINRTPNRVGGNNFKGGGATPLPWEYFNPHTPMGTVGLPHAPLLSQCGGHKIRGGDFCYATQTPQRCEKQGGKINKEGKCCIKRGGSYDSLWGSNSPMFHKVSKPVDYGSLYSHLETSSRGTSGHRPGYTSSLPFGSNPSSCTSTSSSSASSPLYSTGGSTVMSGGSKRTGGSACCKETVVPFSNGYNGYGYHNFGSSDFSSTSSDSSSSFGRVYGDHNVGGQRGGHKAEFAKLKNWLLS